MRRRILKNIELEQIDTCNIVLVENVSGQIFQTPNPEAFTPSKFTPIGIVVIPSSHDVYGTGECGVIALKSASLTTPDNGQSTNCIIYFGQALEYQNLGLPQFSNIVCQGTFNSDLLDTVDGVVEKGRLPLNNVVPNAIECLTDPGTYYQYINNSEIGYVPSPYLIDGSRNPNYYKTDPPSSPTNVLSDFNGKSNTKILIDLATAQSDWKTASLITNNLGIGYSPAACCCWRFHTEGTKQGDWYLPACGEFGYCIPRLSKINAALNKIKSTFKVSICQLNGLYNSYITSSYKQVESIWIINQNSGDVYGWLQNSENFVRPFWRGVLPIRLTE